MFFEEGEFEMLAHVESMKPMATGAKFAARSERVIRRTGAKVVDIRETFGECWGVTEQEALSALAEDFRTWAKAQK